MTAEEILRTMREKHGILLAGSLGVFSGKVIRIGHMGNNARKENMGLVFSALDDTMRELGYPLAASMREVLEQELTDF